MIDFSNSGARMALDTLGLAKQAAFNWGPDYGGTPTPAARPQQRPTGGPMMSTAPEQQPELQSRPMTAPPASRPTAGSFNISARNAQDISGPGRAMPATNGGPDMRQGLGAMAMLTQNPVLGLASVAANRAATQGWGNVARSVGSAATAPIRSYASAMAQGYRNVGQNASAIAQGYRNVGQNAVGGYRQARGANPGPLSMVHGAVGGMEGAVRGVGQNWASVGNRLNEARYQLQGGPNYTPHPPMASPQQSQYSQQVSE